MGKYPVIFISFKDVDGLRFDNARSNLINKIGTEAERFSFLLDSNHISQNEKDKYSALISLEKGEYTMNETMLSSSLNLLSSLLYKHFNKKVIILIDEYDVHLDKAFKNGYYKEMVALIRSLFGQALKTNDSLFFAVLTGCLRVSKESIFTGLNNLKVLSITDTRFDEHFGFTEDEVRMMFSDYEIEDHRELLRLIEGGASCFNHQCFEKGEPNQSLTRCPQAYLRLVPSLVSYDIYASRKRRRPSFLILIAAFWSRSILRPQLHSIVLFFKSFISEWTHPQLWQIWLEA